MNDPMESTERQEWYIEKVLDGVRNKKEKEQVALRDVEKKSLDLYLAC